MPEDESLLKDRTEHGPNQGPARPAWAITALASVLIFTTVVDVLGNLLVIVSVLRNRKLRNAGKKRKAIVIHELDVEGIRRELKSNHKTKRDENETQKEECSQILESQQTTETESESLSDNHLSSRSASDIADNSDDDSDEGQDLEEGPSSTHSNREKSDSEDSNDDKSSCCERSSYKKKSTKLSTEKRQRERVVRQRGVLDEKYILIGADEKLIRKLLRLHLPRPEVAVMPEEHSEEEYVEEEGGAPAVESEDEQSNAATGRQGPKRVRQPKRVYTYDQRLPQSMQNR
ncbi:hypothetical protein PAMA_020926 [Pampus argenteus]